LGEAAEREGRLADAVAAARRGLDLAPDDEAALRRYVALLERTGDAPAALRTYDDFARRLARDVELEPPDETPPLGGAGRARAGPNARRGPAAGGAGSPVGPSPAEASAPASPATIAVLPFAVRGDPRFGYLGEGLVALLATKLDGAGEIRTVDPR